MLESVIRDEVITSVKDDLTKIISKGIENRTMFKAEVISASIVILIFIILIVYLICKKVRRRIKHKFELVQTLIYGFDLIL